MHKSDLLFAFRMVKEFIRTIAAWPQVLNINQSLIDAQLKLNLKHEPTRMFQPKLIVDPSLQDTDLVEYHVKNVKEI